MEFKSAKRTQYWQENGPLVMGLPPINLKVVQEFDIQSLSGVRSPLVSEGLLGGVTGGL